MRTLSFRDAVTQFVGYRSPKLLLFISMSAFVFRLVEPSPLGLLDACIAIGIVLYWPVQEWWMHRWLLHLPAVTIGSKTFEPAFARDHKRHHRFPNDMEYTLLPVSQIVRAGIFYFGLGLLLFQSVSAASTLLSIAALMTLAYEWTHYLTHTTYKPRSAYYRKIWKLHRWHHYKNEHFWFSFTVPYIDGWLGTGPNPKEVPKSKSVRDLDMSNKSATS